MEKSNLDSNKNQMYYVLAIGPEKSGKSNALTSLLGKDLVHVVNDDTLFTGNDVYSIMRSDQPPTAFFFTGSEFVRNNESRHQFIQMVSARKEMGIHVMQECIDTNQVPSLVRSKTAQPDKILIFKTDSKEERKKLYKYFASEHYRRCSLFLHDMDSLSEYEFIILEKGKEPMISVASPRMDALRTWKTLEFIPVDSESDLKEREEREEAEEGKEANRSGPKEKALETNPETDTEVETKAEKVESETQSIKNDPKEIPKKNTSYFWKMFGY